MSLTNPEKVVTTGMLQEYHESILPYLGGMPAIVANKFSKGDLYSTDEKMIGQWIDGKPLYQKTFVGVVVTSGYPFDLRSLNIDSFVSLEGMMNKNVPINYSNGAYYLHVEREMSNDVDRIKCSAASDWNNLPLVITIQYTKTTDEPISIGDGSDYSTEEQVVGTWIDGKPLYQKTVDYGTLPNATRKTVAHNIANIDRIIEIKGFAHNINQIYTQPLPLVFPNNNISYDTSLEVDETEIIMSCAQDRSMMAAYITLQYTKTTD